MKPGPTNPDTGQPLELIFQLVNEDSRLPWPFEAHVVHFYHNYYSGELPFDDGYEPCDYYLKTYPRLRPEHLAQVPRPAIGFSHIRTQPAPSLPNDDELADLAPEDWREVYHAAVTELTGEPDLGGSRSDCKAPGPQVRSGCNLIVRRISPGPIRACCLSAAQLLLTEPLLLAGWAAEG